MKRFLLLIITLCIISCGDPESADPNIIKEKVTDFNSGEDALRYLEVGTEHLYDVTLTTNMTLSQQPPTQFAEVIISGEEVNGEYIFQTVVNGQDLEQIVNSDRFYIEKLPLLEYLPFTLNQDGLEISRPLQLSKTWTVGFWEFTIVNIQNENLEIRVTNNALVDLIVTINYTVGLGPERIEYDFLETRQFNFFNLIIELQK